MLESESCFRDHTLTKCFLVVQRFPFDSQPLTVDLQCYIYGAKDITLQWKNSAVSSEVKDSSVWSFTNYGVQDSKQWISAVGGREWETLRVEVTANRFSCAPA